MTRYFASNGKRISSAVAEMLIAEGADIRVEKVEESIYDLENVARQGQGASIHALYAPQEIGGEIRQYGVCGNSVTKRANYSQGIRQNGLTKIAGTIEKVTCRRCLKKVEQNI